jgi:hypothetical protein
VGGGVVMRLRIHSLFCVLNVMLPACSLNFAGVARAVYTAEQTCSWACVASAQITRYYVIRNLTVSSIQMCWLALGGYPRWHLMSANANICV